MGEGGSYLFGVMELLSYKLQFLAGEKNCSLSALCTLLAGLKFGFYSELILPSEENEKEEKNP